MTIDKLLHALLAVVVMTITCALANHHLQAKRNFWWLLGAGVFIGLLGLITQNGIPFHPIFAVPFQVLSIFALTLVLFRRETWKRKLYVGSAILISNMVSVALSSIVFSAMQGETSLNMDNTINLQTMLEVILIVCFSYLTMLPLRPRSASRINWLSYGLFLLSQSALIFTNMLVINAANPTRPGDYISLGIGVAICIAADVFLYHTMARERNAARQQAEHEALKTLQHMQLRHSQELQDQLHRTSVLRHDIRNHLVALNTLLENDPTKAHSYLRELISAQPNKSEALFCANPIVNAVIYAKSREAAQQNIAFNVELNLPEPLPLSDVELVSLFSNLLDNALLACAVLPEGMDRRITLNAQPDSAHLVIHCENSCIVAPDFDDGLPQTTKVQDGGTGTRAVRQTAREAGGDAVFNVSDGRFIANVAVPL